MALLEVKNLKKVYTTRFTQNQVQALTNVNFSVNKGEYVAIMGESGSGKTTLLNILAALDKPTSGQVLLHGKDITHISEKDIGFTPIPTCLRFDNLLNQIYTSLKSLGSSIRFLRASGVLPVCFSTDSKCSL